MDRNRRHQLLVNCGDSGGASGSEEGAFPVGSVVFSFVEDKAVAVEDGVPGSSVASRNKMKISCHSSLRVVVNAMVSR